MRYTDDVNGVINIGIVNDWLYIYRRIHTVTIKFRIYG